MTIIKPGDNVMVAPGNHFNLVLPDGTVLNVEQTADDFTICRSNGICAYTKPTSKHAIENEDDPRQTTGRN